MQLIFTEYLTELNHKLTWLEILSGPNTVVFFKLDRGDSFVEGKTSKIIGLIAITVLNVNVVMVYWVRHPALTW